MIYKAESILKFGTFKGLKFKDIFLGSTSMASVDHYLKEYLLLFYDRNSNVTTCLPDFYKGKRPELYENDKKLILSISDKVVLEYVQCAIIENITNGIIPLHGEDGHKLLLGHWIQNTLSTEYLSKFKYLASRKKDARFSDLSPTSRLLFNNTSYIIWAINNVDSFVVDPNWLESDHTLTDLSHFEIIEPNLYDKSEILADGEKLFIEGIGPVTTDCSITCTPIFKRTPYKIPANAIKNNRKKYDDYVEVLRRKNEEYQIRNDYDSVDYHNPWNDVLGPEEADLAYWNTN